MTRRPPTEPTSNTVVNFSGNTGGTVHNQSVLKAVGLIGCFIGQSESMTLTELARKTDMNVSTAYRMLQTLTATGVLRRNEGEERYFPGPMLLSLAGSLFSGGGFSAVLDLLNDLVGEVGESVSLAIRSADCIAVVLSVPSPHSLRFQHRAGTRVPIHCSAAGKVLLAYGPLPAQDAVAELGRLLPLTPKSIVSGDVLVSELNAVRQQGYALSDEEHHIGVQSVGVPIFGAHQSIKGAIGIQGPNGRMGRDKVARIVKAAHHTAALIAQLPFLDRLPEP